MARTQLGTGKVTALALNGKPASLVQFDIAGPHSDRHTGLVRKLSGHDGDYIATSALQKEHEVFNWRSWTALSVEETQAVERELGARLPPGILLENIRISGIPRFSQLPPTSRLVFPKREGRQAILAVWEENGPCKGVGQRVADLYGRQELCSQYIRIARHRRGVMGLVLSEGTVMIDDEVLVYAPV